MTDQRTSTFAFHLKALSLVRPSSMKWHYARLCLLLTLAILLEMPLRFAGYGTFLFGTLIMSIVFAAAGAAGDTKILRRVFLAFVTPVILIDLKMVAMGAGDRLAMVGSAFHVGLLSLTAVAILSHIIRQERVSLDTILGGICVYLLIGETFTFLYSVIELIQPGAFLESGQPLSIPPNVNHLLGRRPELTYFSLTTLTTLGYGDIVPVAPFARIFAAAEALIGQIFLTTFLAFLVGNYVSQRQEDRLKAAAE